MKFQYIISVFVLLFSCQKQESKEVTVVKETKEEKVELAHLMGYMQKYHEKLYFSGKESNWELAAFYLDEIEETAEHIEKANIMEDEISISQTIKSMLPPAIEKLEKTIKAKDSKAFIKDFELLTTTCSGCHSVAKHPFIKIQVPTQSNFSNQNFKP